MLLYQVSGTSICSLTTKHGGAKGNKANLTNGSESLRAVRKIRKKFYYFNIIMTIINVILLFYCEDIFLFIIINYGEISQQPENNYRQYRNNTIQYTL